MATIRHAEISVERQTSGGYLLAVVHNGQRIHARYFDYTLRECKARFIADIKAGLLPRTGGGWSAAVLAVGAL